MTIRLGECNPGFMGKVESLDSGESRLLERIQEMGFIPGGEIQVLHQAPIFCDPIAVRVRGSIVAIRRQEANLIFVRPQATQTEAQK